MTINTIIAYSMVGTFKICGVLKLSVATEYLGCKNKATFCNGKKSEMGICEKCGKTDFLETCKRNEVHEFKFIKYAIQNVFKL